MAYEKISLVEFVRRLETGSYETVTAARRAIMKTSLCDEDVARGRRKINDYFKSDERPITGKRQYTGTKPNKVIVIVVQFLSYDHGTRLAILELLESVAHTGLSLKKLHKMLVEANDKLRTK